MRPAKPRLTDHSTKANETTARLLLLWLNRPLTESLTASASAVKTRLMN